MFLPPAYTACIGIIWGFLPVFADTQFSISASAIGILVTLGIFVSGVIQVPMGWAADRFERKRLVLLGGAIVTASVYAFSHATGFWYMFYASIVFGLGGGICMPALMAVAVLWGSRSEAMGSVMALLTVAHSLGMLLGSVLAGVMMDLFELRHAFMLGSLTMVAGILVFLVCTWRRDLNHGTAHRAAQPIPEG